MQINKHYHLQLVNSRDSLGAADHPEGIRHVSCSGDYCRPIGHPSTTWLSENPVVIWKKSCCGSCKDWNCAGL